jgi:uncharacterized protein YidB (DUF937 family)
MQQIWHFSFFAPLVVDALTVQGEIPAGSLDPPAWVKQS